MREMAGLFAAENLVTRLRSSTPEFVETSRSSTLASTLTWGRGRKQKNQLQLRSGRIAEGGNLGVYGPPPKGKSRGGPP